jgi:hypothetical protein
MVGPVTFRPVVRQNIMAEGAHEGGCSPQGSQEAKRELPFIAQLLSPNPLDYEYINGLMHC